MFEIGIQADEMEGHSTAVAAMSLTSSWRGRAVRGLCYDVLCKKQDMTPITLRKPTGCGILLCRDVGGKVPMGFM